MCFKEPQEVNFQHFFSILIQFFPCGTKIKFFWKNFINRKGIKKNCRKLERLKAKVKFIFFFPSVDYLNCELQKGGRGKGCETTALRGMEVKENSIVMLQICSEKNKNLKN